MNLYSIFFIVVFIYLVIWISYDHRVFAQTPLQEQRLEEISHMDNPLENYSFIKAGKSPSNPSIISVEDKIGGLTNMYVYVLNSGSDSVSVINGTTNTKRSAASAPGPSAAARWPTPTLTVLIVGSGPARAAPFVSASGRSRSRRVERRLWCRSPAARRGARCRAAACRRQGRSACERSRTRRARAAPPGHPGHVAHRRRGHPAARWVHTGRCLAGSAGRPAQDRRCLPVPRQSGRALRDTRAPVTPLAESWTP